VTRSSRAKLKAAIKQSEANLQSADLDWSRLQRLRETQATSEQELAYARATLLSARAAVEMAEHQLVEAEAALQYARDDLAKTVIEAPIGGVVSQLFAEQGEVVITGTMNNPGTRIMVISDLSKMQVRCRVDESDASLVAPGQTARIYLQSDTRRSVPGDVLRVATKGTKLLGRDVVTFETLVLVGSNDARVKPGMTANLEIEVARREQALVIPVQGVVYRKRRDLPEELVKEHERQEAELEPAARQHLAEYVKIVFCVEEEKARARLVQTGVNDATGVEVIEGLTLDDAVVIGPYRSLDQLQDGSPVKPLEEKTADESATHEGGRR
jgi:HlyD family secretion protein